MCILAVADKRRPTEEELEKMHLTNGDGGGIAYRIGNGEVKWEKGLDLPQMKELCAQVPMPFAFHFRIASIGPKIKELTHPFPVERDVRTALSGTTKGSVLFHNGTWSSYRERGIDHAIKNKIRVPEGKWSDSRVMAWLTHLHGQGILELIDEKVILFGPTKIEIFHPDGWFRISDLLVSNRLWEYRTVNHKQTDDNWDYMHQRNQWQNGGQICRIGNCKKEVVGGGFYCEEHQPPCRFLNCTKPRLVGSENCLEHAPSCTVIGCSEKREPGEKFCLKHLIITKPEGASSVIPFRSGADLVPKGDDNKADAGSDGKEVVPMGQELQEPAVLKDPVLQAARTWACALNPKVLHGTHGALTHLVDNRRNDDDVKLTIM